MELKRKFKPCPLCEGDVMYYDGTRPHDETFGKHFICMRCDTMFSSTIIDIVWNQRDLENKMRCCGNCNNWSAQREFCNEKQDRYAGNSVCGEWKFTTDDHGDIK